jgi:type II restriction/modification system DNA methylase subunit YeeA
MLKFKKHLLFNLAKYSILFVMIINYHSYKITTIAHWNRNHSLKTLNLQELNVTMKLY